MQNKNIEKINKKTFCVGDIHGANKALKQVLERCNFDYEEDTLITLGDIADGWYEVPQCVETLLKIKKLINVRGNHDVWVYDWLTYGLQPTAWLEQGGRATIKAYIETKKFDEDKHTKFWRSQHDWYIDEGNNLFIHGGWNYRNGFPEGAKEPINAGTIAKSCHWDRSLEKSAKSAHFSNNRFKALEQFNKIFIGHTALKGVEPKKYLNLWNLDTGAGWNGKLTIMDVNTEEYWQSDLVVDLYPDKKR